MSEALLLAAMEQLADTVEAENAALRTLNMAAATALLPAKEAATHALALARKTAPPSPALRPAAAKLMQAAEENRQLLERALTVQTRVLGVLARAARSSNPAPRYGRSGSYAAQRPSGWALSARA